MVKAIGCDLSPAFDALVKIIKKLRCVALKAFADADTKATSLVSASIAT